MSKRERPLDDDMRRCPFCLVHFRQPRRSRRYPPSRCHPCGARRVRDEESNCCPGARVWIKVGIRLCACCKSTIIRR